MSQLRSVSYNTAIQLVGKVLSVGLGLVSLGLLTHYLGVEQFGWYVTVITFLQFIGIVNDFGLVPVTAQMIAEGRYEEKRLVHNLLSYRLVTSILFFGVAPAIALLFPYPVEVKVAIAFSTLNFVAVNINQVVIGYNQARLAMIFQAVGEVLSRAVLVLGLYFVVVKDLGFYSAMIAVTVAAILFTLVTVVSLFRGKVFGFAFEKEVWQAIWHKSWPISIAIIFNVVYLRGDTLLLSLFRSQSEVGLYGAAYRVIDVLAQTAMMIVGILLPIMTAAWVSGKRELFQARYQQSFNAMMLVALPISVGLFLLAEPILFLVTPAEFVGAVLPLKILSFAVFGVYLGAVFGHAVVAVNAQRRALWIYGSTALITLIGYLFLIPRFGMIGAASMTVFSEIYTGVLLYLLVYKETATGLSLGVVARIVISCLVMAAVVVWATPLNLFMQIFLGGAVYIVALYGTGVVTPTMVRELVGREKTV